jgi:hypothetical protein
MNKEEICIVPTLSVFGGTKKGRKRGGPSQTNVFAAFVYFSKLIMSISYFSLIARRELLEGGN